MTENKSNRWHQHQRINLKSIQSMEDDLKRILDSRKEMQERGQHQKDEL